MSLHLPVAILAALSLTSGDRVVGLYDGPLMGISHARLAHSSLKPDLSEVIAKETPARIEKLNASIADDFRIAPERVVSEDVNRPDHGPPLMSFSARARLFGLAICTALVALILAFFFGCSLKTSSSTMSDRDSAILPQARREVRCYYCGSSSQHCLPLGVTHPAKQTMPSRPGLAPSGSSRHSSLPWRPLWNHFGKSSSALGWMQEIG